MGVLAPCLCALAQGEKQFDFGQNWQDFSARALSPGSVARARLEFERLIEPVDLRGLSFLDIGFGQGLSLLSAAAMGARAMGCDINSKCFSLLDYNLKHFPELERSPPAVIGSILDPQVVRRLREVEPTGHYDVVHSWGVLHHTGDMQLAIANAASLVAPGGVFILAIYNRHWSSLPWKSVKRLFTLAPHFVKRLLIGAFYPIIYVAKWLVTRRNPRIQERGMDFYFNVVDWVGGYPYEYAGIEELRSKVEPLGFELVRSVAAEVPTGCNQFVFRRIVAPSSSGSVF
jgi:SAM-dependent methyltransferase